MKRFWFLIFIPLLFLCGCKEKEVPYSVITRDLYSTGGEISFSYDNITHSAYFGGENEVVQYYEEDISKGWSEKGNRIGIRIVAPTKITDHLSARATIGGNEYKNGSFYKLVNGQMSAVAEFYPIVSQENREVELRIVWQDGIKEQLYKIYIKEGTIFL